MSQLTELTHGERRTIDGIDSVGLAPLPVTTGRQPTTVSQFITPSDNGLLEIRQISGDIHMTQFILVFMLTMSLMLAWWWWGTGEDWYIAIPIFGPITYGIATMFYTDLKEHAKSVANEPPVCFHPQKQQMLVSWEKSNRPRPKRPDMSISNKSFFMAIAAFFLVGGEGMMLLSNIDKLITGNHEMLYWSVPILILGVYPTYYTVKPWFAYLKQKKGYISSVEIVPVEWESVHIEYQSTSGFNPFGIVNLQNLTFSAAIPEHPDNERVLFSIPVYSYEEALSLYELLCDFMENGAQGIEHTAAANIKIDNSGYSREGYRRLIEKRAEETPLIYPFWRLLNVLTLRYFAHWYQEYLMETLQLKALNRPEVKQWSKLIPAEEWQKPSEALQQANKAVRKLYTQGHVWESEEVQQVVRRYRPEIEQVEDDSPYSRLTPWSE